MLTSLGGLTKSDGGSLDGFRSALIFKLSKYCIQGCPAKGQTSKIYLGRIFDDFYLM